jgi:glutathione synthase/RimK-type ligase-like ATP-grasp enzyme
LTSSPVARVLLVSRPGDAHGDRVQDALAAEGATILRLSLNVWRRKTITWDGEDRLLALTDTGPVLVGPECTVWWRRPGWVETEDLAEADAELARAEGLALLRGILHAIGPRWIDPPWLVDLAELKPYQLVTARRLGVRSPETVVTNDLETMRAMSMRTAVLAKAASGGPGLTAFVAAPPEALMDLVRAAPTMLQAEVAAFCDTRVVTVGQAVFAWRRPRKEHDPVDWRAVDPEGDGFSPCVLDWQDQPLRLANELGLSHSVQDWLETIDGPVFLEVNPAGNWLFLRDSGSTVLPALVSHLLR